MSVKLRKAEDELNAVAAEKGDLLLEQGKLEQELEVSSPNYCLFRPLG